MAGQHEPMAGKRETLRAKTTQQAAAAASAAGDDPPDRGGQYGNLAAQAAALIAGKPAHVPGTFDAHPPEEEDHEDEDGGGEEGRAPGGHEGAAEDEEEAGEAERAGPPQSIDDAAKALGMSRKDFNALTLQVGSESMTLGQLKDKLPEVLKLDRARDELDDERGMWELERIGQYRRLSAIIDALPKNAQTAGLLRQLEAQHESTRARELETLHFARPRWSDPNYATAAREKITSLAKEYGFSRTEVEGLMDHRQVLLVQDFADLRERVRSSRDAARKLAEGSAERPSGQKGAAGAGGGSSVNGTGNARRAPKATQESIAKRAGSIMHRR